MHWRITWTCIAFPGGIPDEVATGQHDHTKPYPEDSGVRWELNPIMREVIGEENGDE